MSTRELLLENIESVKALIVKHDTENQSPAVARQLASLREHKAELESIAAAAWCKCPQCGSISPRAPDKYMNECFQCGFMFDNDKSANTAGLAVNS